MRLVIGGKVNPKYVDELQEQYSNAKTSVEKHKIKSEFYSLRGKVKESELDKVWTQQITRKDFYYYE